MNHFMRVFHYPTYKYLSNSSELLVKIFDYKIVSLFETMKPYDTWFIGRKGHLWRSWSWWSTSVGLALRGFYLTESSFLPSKEHDRDMTSGNHTKQEMRTTTVGCWAAAEFLRSFAYFCISLELFGLMLGWVPLFFLWVIYFFPLEL